MTLLLGRTRRMTVHSGDLRQPMVASEWVPLEKMAGSPTLESLTGRWSLRFVLGLSLAMMVSLGCTSSLIAQPVAGDQAASSIRALAYPQPPVASVGWLSSGSVGLAGARTKSELPRTIDTLVICPQAFQAELKRWVDYRTSQSHSISVVTPGRSAFEVRQQIRSVAKTNNLKAIVIVGDAGDRQTDPQLKVPTDYVMARDIARFGSVLEIATDNRYADIDGDSLPDVSIGRIPVDSAAELKSFIDRVIRYEQQSLPAEALRRINFVAGVGGFGQLIDGVIEETTKQIITDLMPGHIETSMTYGSWTSPYCPDPRCFSKSCQERFNEGCLFWVYIGHGAKRYLDFVRMPNKNYEILDCQSVDKICCQQGSPIAVFLACYTNAFDGDEDSLAEMMLKQPCGPIATIGGTRITKPAAMGLMSLEMMHEYYYGKTRTLGEICLNSKRRMVEGSKHFSKYRELIEGLANSYTPGGSFRVEKQEHLDLMHLLGDPLLVMPRPQPIVFAAEKEATAGETLQVTGKSPGKGTMILELAYRRDRLRQRFKRRRKFDSSDGSFEEYQTTYDQSRDLVCNRVLVEVNRGMFATKIKIPRDTHGACVLRAILQPETGAPGLGSADIMIRKPQPLRESE